MRVSNEDRSYGTIRLTGHSWARNSRQGVSMYRIQGTSRYIYIYCLGTVSIHDMYTACIWCVCHLHSSVEVSIIWNWQCADDRCIKPTRTRITYVSSLEMTCYWRQRYVISRSDCSWRNYLMIASLSYACYIEMNPINSISHCSDSKMFICWIIVDICDSWQQRRWDGTSIECCLSLVLSVWWSTCLSIGYG